MPSHLISETGRVFALSQCKHGVSRVSRSPHAGGSEPAAKRQKGKSAATVAFGVAVQAETQQVSDDCHLGCRLCYPVVDSVNVGQPDVPYAKHCTASLILCTHTRARTSVPSALKQNDSHSNSLSCLFSFMPSFVPCLVASKTASSFYFEAAIV